MKNKHLAWLAVSSLIGLPAAHADIELIATANINGTYEDLAHNTAKPLENGVPGDRLGGIGSGLAYAGGTTFLALPDRGPNAASYNGAVDDTSCMPRSALSRIVIHVADDVPSGRATMCHRNGIHILGHPCGLCPKTARTEDH